MILLTRWTYRGDWKGFTKGRFGLDLEEPEAPVAGCCRKLIYPCSSCYLSPCVLRVHPRVLRVLRFPRFPLSSIREDRPNKRGHTSSVGLLSLLCQSRRIDSSGPHANPYGHSCD